MRKRFLPGDKPDEQALKEALRVDHAGEYGAIHIYRGQLRALKNHKVAPIIKEMLEQEQEHLSYFEGALKEHNAEASKLLPLWRTLGYGAGYLTGLMGKRAAMACTVAVEEVIDAHYEEQLQTLKDKPLKKAILQFQADEVHHKEIGLEHEAEQAPFYKALRQVIRQGSKLAIEVAKKI